VRPGLLLGLALREAQGPHPAPRPAPGR